MHASTSCGAKSNITESTLQVMIYLMGKEERRAPNVEEKLELWKQNKSYPEEALFTRFTFILLCFHFSYPFFIPSTVVFLLSLHRLLFFSFLFFQTSTFLVRAAISESFRSLWFLACSTDQDLLRRCIPSLTYIFNSSFVARLGNRSCISHGRITSRQQPRQTSYPRNFAQPNQPNSDEFKSWYTGFSWLGPGLGTRRNSSEWETNT
jgi:hypothetical protein